MYDYCGIVYADDSENPTLVKVYDLNNLGPSCGSCGYPDTTPLDPQPAEAREDRGWGPCAQQPQALVGAAVRMNCRFHLCPLQAGKNCPLPVCEEGGKGSCILFALPTST